MKRKFPKIIYERADANRPLDKFSVVCGLEARDGPFPVSAVSSELSRSVAEYRIRSRRSVASSRHGPLRTEASFDLYEQSQEQGRHGTNAEAIEKSWPTKPEARRYYSELIAVQTYRLVEKSVANSWWYPAGAEGSLPF